MENGDRTTRNLICCNTNETCVHLKINWRCFNTHLASQYGCHNRLYYYITLIFISLSLLAIDQILPKEINHKISHMDRIEN